MLEKIKKVLGFKRKYYITIKNENAYNSLTWCEENLPPYPAWVCEQCFDPSLEEDAEITYRFTFINKCDATQFKLMGF